MARTDFIKKLVNAFQLDANLEAIPEKVATSFVPTFQVNIPVPTIREVVDVVLNDSSKDFKVPKGKQWKLLYGSTSLITTATVGDRQFQLVFRDSADDIIYIIRAAAVQAASLTEFYSLGQFGDTAQTVDGRHTIPIPINAILDENFSIRIEDSAAIAPTDDDLAVRFIVEERDMVEGDTIKTAL